jgi:hypothetical protein
MAWWRWMAREEVGEVAAGMADTTTVAGIGMRGYYRWNGDWRWWGGGWNPWWVIPVPVPYPYYGGYHCPGYTIRRGFPGRIRGRNRFRPRRRESLEKISESVAETEIGLDKIVPGGMRSAPEPVVGRLAEDPDMRGKAVL